MYPFSSAGFVPAPMRHSIWLLTGALVFCAPVVPAADSQATIRCDLQSGSEQLALTFLVDTVARRAYAVRNDSLSEISVVPNQSGGITFIEVTESGDVTTTTANRAGDAVHNRSMIVNGDLVASQYLGRCE